MTKEQFQRACEINERLRQLQEVKKVIHETTTHRITYTCNYGRASGDYTPCNAYIMSYIGPLLDRHDKMIRAEIDNEIAALEQEIETL